MLMLKGNNKKKKIILGTIIICVILIIAIIIFMLNNNKEDKILFKSYYINGAWGHRESSYTIYSNGVIELYNNYDGDITQKKQRFLKMN